MVHILGIYKKNIFLNVGITFKNENSQLNSKQYTMHN